MTQKLTYLNTAAVGLISQESYEAASKFQQKMMRNPADASLEWKQNNFENLREKMATMLHTQPKRVAFIPNFSYGLLGIMESIKPKVKKVLLFEDDYPSLKMPFELGDFNVSYVPSLDHFSINLSRIIDIAEKEHIEAIVISHVQFLSGFTIDLNILSNFCKTKGIVLIVDVTQSLGAIDINFDNLNIDVLIGSTYKWMNGGWGSGVMTIKDSFMERFPPRLAGLGSLNMDSKGWSYSPSVLSYEGGHLNPVSMIRLEKAVEKRLEIGLANVQEHNKNLLKLLGQELRKTSFRVRGGNDVENLATILVFEAEEYIHGYLAERNFSVTWRKGLIRVSPHFYNDEEDIKRFVKALIDWENGDF